MKRLLSLILALALMLPLCAAALADEATREFTDSTGRTFTLPATLDRIAVSGPLAEIVLFALAPDKLVGLATPWDDAAKSYFPEEYTALPVLGQLYGTKGDMNLEALLAADPQVVIDVGASKGSIAEDLDALEAKTGIPFLHIAATLETSDAAYLALGELLGLEAEARELADYCRRTYDTAADIASRADKVRLLYVLGVDGLHVIANGSYHSEIVDLLSDNVAVVESPSSKGTGNEVDMEQILLWNPDCVVFAPESVYATAANDPLWQNVAAIQNGRFYKVPYGPHNWMGFPPGAHRLLGMLWLAKTLYPDLADYDLYTETAEFYRLFYHCELTREQFDALTSPQ